MRGRSVVFALFAMGAMLFAVDGVRAAGEPQAAIVGLVTSAAEGNMEGVLVTARRTGSKMATTVVSDASGRYAFPASRLAPGHYDLSIRAAGYDLSGGSAGADVGTGTATADLKLVPARDLASQLSNSEWMMSVPGTPAQKVQLLNCVTCHTLQRIVSSRYTADEFVRVIGRMAGYSNNSSPLTPQRRQGVTENLGNPQRLADYLASINQSSGPPQYQLKTLPRPSGDATRVIYTTYDLPTKAWEPHDVMLDRKGMVWFDDFVEQKLGVLDPKTGAITQYAVPTIKEGFPNGALDMEIGRDGHVWLANMFQGGIQEFDPQTKQFKTRPLPAPWQGDKSQQTFLAPPGPDGIMYVKDNGTQHIFQVNLAANTWRPFGPYKDETHTYGTYQIFADSKGNVYGNDFTGGFGKSIVKFDAKTGEATIYAVSQDVSRPRRGKMDAQDRLWFAEYQGNDIGVLDTRTGAVTTWHTPAYTFPYDAAPGKNGEVWAAGITSDRVIRLDPKSGKLIVYGLPDATNARDIYVDNTGPRATFWVGNNHAGQIYKLETID